jgi:hypothetical protein
MKSLLANSFEFSNDNNNNNSGCGGGSGGINGSGRTSDANSAAVDVGAGAGGKNSRGFGSSSSSGSSSGQRRRSPSPEHHRTPGFGVPWALGNNHNNNNNNSTSLKQQQQQREEEEQQQQQRGVSFQEYEQEHRQDQQEHRQEQWQGRDRGGAWGREGGGEAALSSGKGNRETTTLLLPEKARMQAADLDRAAGTLERLRTTLRQKGLANGCLEFGRALRWGAAVEKKNKSDGDGGGGGEESSLLLGAKEFHASLERFSSLTARHHNQSHHQHPQQQQQQSLLLGEGAVFVVSEGEAHALFHLLCQSKGSNNNNNNNNSSTMPPFFLSPADILDGVYGNQADDNRSGGDGGGGASSSSSFSTQRSNFVKSVFQTLHRTQPQLRAASSPSMNRNGPMAASMPVGAAVVALSATALAQRFNPLPMVVVDGDDEESGVWPTKEQALNEFLETFECRDGKVTPTTSTTSAFAFAAASYSYSSCYFCSFCFFRVAFRIQVLEEDFDEYYKHVAFAHGWSSSSSPVGVAAAPAGAAHARGGARDWRSFERMLLGCWGLLLPLEQEERDGGGSSGSSSSFSAAAAAPPPVPPPPGPLIGGRATVSSSSSLLGGPATTASMESSWMKDQVGWVVIGDVVVVGFMSQLPYIFCCWDI